MLSVREYICAGQTRFAERKMKLELEILDSTLSVVTISADNLSIDISHGTLFQ